MIQAAPFTPIAGDLMAMADDPEKLAEDTTLEQRMTDGGVFSSDGKVFWDGELLSPTFATGPRFWEFCAWPSPVSL